MQSNTHAHTHIPTYTHTFTHPHTHTLTMRKGFQLTLSAHTKLAWLSCKYAMGSCRQAGRQAGSGWGRGRKVRAAWRWHERWVRAGKEAHFISANNDGHHLWHSHWHWHWHWHWGCVPYYSCAAWATCCKPLYAQHPWGFLTLRVRVSMCVSVWARGRVYSGILDLRCSRCVCGCVLQCSIHYV